MSGRLVASLQCVFVVESERLVWSTFRGVRRSGSRRAGSESARRRRPSLVAFGQRAYGRRCGSPGLPHPRGPSCAQRGMSWSWAVRRRGCDLRGWMRDRRTAPLAARPSDLGQDVLHARVVVQERLSARSAGASLRFPRCDRRARSAQLAPGARRVDLRPLVLGAHR